ncbi:hypothetical protein AOLI_G00221410 [Acnodon oligacanthus]
MISVRLPSAEQPSWTRVRHTLNPECVTAARANPSGLSSCFSTTDSARAGALAWPVLNPPALIGSERTAELKPHLTRLGDRLANVFGSDRSFEVSMTDPAHVTAYDSCSQQVHDLHIIVTVATARGNSLQPWSPRGRSDSAVKDEAVRLGRFRSFDARFSDSGPELLTAQIPDHLKHHHLGHLERGWHA